MTQKQFAIPHDKISAFCKRWNVSEFALFGSALRADFRPESDVDVLVTFSDNSNWGVVRSRPNAAGASGFIRSQSRSDLTPGPRSHSEQAPS
jgi:hypothetical protein